MKPSLQISIVSLFIALFMTASLGVAWYTHTTGTEVVLDLSDTVIAQVTDATIEKTRNYLEPLSTSAQLIASLVPEDPIGNEEQRAFLADYMVDTIKAYPQIYAVYCGFEVGGFLQVVRVREGREKIGETRVPEGALYMVRVLDRPEGGPSTELRSFYNASGEVMLQVKDEDLVYEPRERPWYIGSKKSNALFWSDLYVYYTLQKPGVTASVPIHDAQGKLTGVVAADVELDQLSAFLHGFEIGRSGRVFITNERQELVAFPDPSQSIRLEDGKPKLVSMSQLEDASLREAGQLYEKNRQDKFSLSVGGVDYLASFTPLPVAGGKAWTVGVVVPTDDYIGILKTTNRNILIFSAAILLMGVVLINIFGRFISRPVRLLAAEANKIKSLELDGVLEIHSRIDEVSELAASMARMKTAIQAFSKFVPKGLVEQLMDSGEGVELGGQRRDLVILFMDIVGFTSISESMNPEALALHISEYFDEMTRILMQHNGVIDKYIGDSIMAFWGAPRSNEKRYTDACSALLEARTRLDALNAQWLDEGKPVLHTRFGLHGGPSIVGNVGSSERMNYSAFGDVVNVASRLEGLNRMYGTSICVSEHIHERAHEGFLMRPLDLIAVKGRQAGIRVYELLEEREGGAPEVAECVDLSTRALDAYLNRSWDEAIELYQNLLEKFPADHPAELLLARCLDYKAHPPDDAWSGVFAALSK